MAAAEDVSAPDEHSAEPIEVNADGVPISAEGLLYHPIGHKEGDEPAPLVVST